MIVNEIREPVQTILVKNKDEAKEKLYELYGTDYEIINLRPKLKGGFLGIGQHEMLEVSYVNKKRTQTANIQTPQNFMKSKEELLKNVGVSNPSISVFSNQFQDLNKKLDELTKIVEKTSTSSNEVHPSILKIQEMLSANEFTFNFIQEISNKIKSTFPLEQLDDFDLVEKRVVDWIGESINIAPEKVYRSPHVVIIVGPTGVGKTTTLVKLAAQFVMKAQKEDRKVELCFITTDTMRVGAFEQLERFGKIFNLDVKKAENSSDVQKIYEDVKNHVDAVFIDTSGYSPNDATHIGSMKATLDVPGMNPDVYLAVTASTKARDLQNIMRNYEPFGYKSVIITKCDESQQFGNVISVLWEKNKSVSYVTTGQKAAGCIERADQINFLIRLEDFNVDRIHIEDKFGVN